MKESYKVCSTHSVKLKNLKVVIYKNKYFPQQYVPKKTKLLNKIMDSEKKRLIMDQLLNTEDEEEIAENVRHKLMAQENERIFYNNARPNLPKTAINNSKNKSTVHRKVPFIILERHKLNNMISKLKQEEKHSNKQKQLLICLKNIHYPKPNVWLIPINLINAIKDSLLTRNWSNVTYLLLQLINCPDNKYKPILKKVYQIMDKLNPLMVENDLQGEYKKLLAARIQILDSTTVV